ncbi:LysR substrate-binding domain-containing protein [Paraburkholderia sp. SIMBA_030]|uniref:LysR substrate-binding domain-containing protein n=1 Tax=Paraburkholderia sp. SIMBA_030 TaxID=3085773 RepID=UPI00397BF84F
MHINDTDALLKLAIRGHGVALLPTWACGRALEDGRLVPPSAWMGSPVEEGNTCRLGRLSTQEDRLIEGSSFYRLLYGNLRERKPVESRTATV